MSARVVPSATQLAIRNSQNAEIGNLKQAFDQIWAYNLARLILIDAIKVTLQGHHGCNGRLT